MAMVNSPSGSMFKIVDGFLQGVNTSTSIGINYPYKAMMDILTDPETRSPRECLQSQLFIEDMSVGMDDPDPDTGANIGIYNRWVYTRDGNVVELETTIHTDMCQQYRMIINGVPIVFKFWPQRDEFSLMVADNASYKFQIVDAVLKVCFARFHPNTVVANNNILASYPVLYPIRRSEIKCFNIAAGQYSFGADDFCNTAPDVLYVCMVKSEAFNCAVALNPFNFEHLNCNFAAFYVDGKSVHSKPFQPGL